MSPNRCRDSVVLLILTCFHPRSLDLPPSLTVGHHVAILSMDQQCSIRTRSSLFSVNLRNGLITSKAIRSNMSHSTIHSRIGTFVVGASQEHRTNLFPRDWTEGCLRCLRDIESIAPAVRLRFDERLNYETLSQYRLLFLSNSACLSDEQCEAIRRFVGEGGYAHRHP